MALIISIFNNEKGTAGQVPSDVQQPGDGSPLFSFQDAESAYAGRYIEAQYSYSPYGRGLLFTAGCNYAVPNTPLDNDCTKACRNNSQIFSDPYTVQNCMLMASLAPISSGSIGHLDENSADQLEAFHIDVNDTDFQDLAENIYGSISSCLNQFCDSNAGCGYNACPWTYVRGVVESTHASCFSSICSTSVPAPLNRRRWYWGLHLILSAKRYRARIFRAAETTSHSLLSNMPPTAPAAVSNMALCLVQNQVSGSGCADTFARLLEFQKARCFFMLAIDIAAQVPVNQGTLNQGTTSFQGLYSNYSLIGLISVSGLLPVTFTLLSLHTGGMHSWYLPIRSTDTATLSVATFYYTGNFSPSPADCHQLQTATNHLYSHYGDRDPSVFCLRTYQDITSLSIAQRGIGGIPRFTLFVVAILIFDRCGVQEAQIIQRFMKGNLKQLESALRPAKHNQRCFSFARALASIGVTDARSFTNAVSETMYCIWFLFFFGLFLEKLSSPTIVA
ncbi:hypothetical protein HO173_008651 [Letharia columbiana]|uniref:Uncharacterized protein n=1 Tax=Letharia columbiana TaxID=112416 RepID=A0A8H6FR13_9LECA|nr:uncharacterized protein HO173_008651 [Letharia columbiana]KAF6233107.1 hypothetical protein HO173_008651 [Letharia columbiana]